MGKIKLPLLIRIPSYYLTFFNKEEWQNEGQSSKGYYLLSLNKNWSIGRMGKRRLEWFLKFKRIVNASGYQLIELPIPEGTSGMPFDYSIPYPINPLQWYLWIRNAKAYCGLRFHAIVSCISAGTPFFSVDSYGSTSKITFLLTLLGFYKAAGQADKKSKIRNLLAGSGFESHRIDTYIENMPPARLFQKLENSDIEDILQLRDRYISVFKKNMQNILNDCNI